jgi:four helix bundle protein
MINSYRDLAVYQRAMQLLVPLHKHLLAFPDYEKYELCAQMRRCSKSIAANIAEGYSKRRFEKEFRKHLNIAMGEANEMLVHLETARMLEYMRAADTDVLIDGYSIVGKQLYKLMTNWRTFPSVQDG